MRTLRSRLALIGVGLASLVLAGGTGIAAAAGAGVPLDLTPVDISAYPQTSTILSSPASLQGGELTATDITVTEGGSVRPVQLTRLPGDKLDVILVLDISGSMAGAPFTAARAAASRFLDRLPASARVGLVTFAQKPVLSHELTTDRAAIRAAIDSSRPAGNTALYDAVTQAVSNFSADAGTRKSLVVLSDGGDTASQGTIDTASAAVRSAGARLDVAELVTKESDETALQRLTEAGNGRITSATDPSQLTAVYDSIAATLANQYRLTWTSAAVGQTDVAVHLVHGGTAAETSFKITYPGAPAPSTTASSTIAASAGNAKIGGSWLLPIGILCAGAALFLLGSQLFSGDDRRRRLSRLGASGLNLAKTTSLSGIRSRATASADNVLERHGRRSAIDARLEDAGVNLRPGEYVVLAAVALFIAALVGVIAGGLILGLLLAVLTGLGAHLALGILRNRRRRLFQEQLDQSLQLLAGSIRAGHGLLQAVDSLSQEAAEPTRTEFRRLVIETRLGRDLSEALAGMAARMDTEDFEWVVQAIDINREVGGDLAEVLETVAGTIRERNELAREVQSLVRKVGSPPTC